MILAVIVAAATLMIACELAVNARPWPQVAGWWGRALLLNGVQLTLAWVAAHTWELGMADWRPWSADSLGTTGGALVGYFVITFIYYWWHRWRHAVGVLWRWLHQVHHSPARIEIITSFYKHPLEILANSWLSTAILYLLVGVGPEACAYAVLITGLAELFYHWNIRTPYWIGFFIQRPESHCVHHQRDLHAYNYADLPLWDILFGTFHNPRNWRGSCGFALDGERNLGKLLSGEEIS